VAPGCAARRQLSPALPTGRAMLEFVDHLTGELNRLTPSGIAIYRPARLQRPYGETSIVLRNGIGGKQNVDASS
jgi:hypothetical protein